MGTEPLSYTTDAVADGQKFTSNHFERNLRQLRSFYYENGTEKSLCKREKIVIFHG